MSDIRDVLQNRTSGLALSLRNADEFNAIGAKGMIKRKRALRATLVAGVAAVGVIVVGAGAWAGYGAMKVTPAVSPSSSPSTTPSASSTPSPSATPSAAPVVYEGRNPNMTDAEALARAEHPATGEVWLATPEKVEPGDWSKDDLWSRIRRRPDVVPRRSPRRQRDPVTGPGCAARRGFAGRNARVIVAPRPDQPAEVAEPYTADDFPSRRRHLDLLRLARSARHHNDARRQHGGPAVRHHFRRFSFDNNPTAKLTRSDLRRQCRDAGDHYTAERPVGHPGRVCAEGRGGAKVSTTLCTTPYGGVVPVHFVPDTQPSCMGGRLR